MTLERAPSHNLASAIREMSIKAYAVSAKTYSEKDVPALVFSAGALAVYVATVGLHRIYGIGFTDRMTDDPFVIPALAGFTESMAGMLVADKVVNKRIPLSSVGKATARTLLNCTHPRK